jgi:WD40 repeat protein
VKTVTCVAISTLGRWLAVGESGYSPRVLLYSTAPDAPSDVPTSIISEHAIGVKSVAFSSDSKYLATLGHLNDGYVYIWSIHPKTGQVTLLAANKCTTNICSMTWCGHTLITVGTRHVKAWSLRDLAKVTPRKTRAKPDESPLPGPATLHGRNVLLGSLVDCTFSCVVAIDESTAALGTDAGHLCMIRPDGSLEVQVIKSYRQGISCITWQPNTGKIIVGSRTGLVYESYEEVVASMQAVNANGLRPSQKRVRSSAVRMSLGLSHGDAVGISAVGCLSQHTIALDSDGNLQMESIAEESSRPEIAFASHSDLIQGVQIVPEEAQLGDFFTWSRRGELKFWDTNGTMLRSKRIELDQVNLEEDSNANELRIARYASSQRLFVLGDRVGLLKVIDQEGDHYSWMGRAHGAEVTDIALHEASSLVASCGRDRMVQVFALAGGSLELLQTLDEHVGAVSRVSFSVDGGKLLSCSADRTIVVREQVRRDTAERAASAYLAMRIITLRSAPLSLTFLNESANIALVSTNDRHVVKVDLAAGTILESIKVTDPENDDTVALGATAISLRGAGETIPDLLIGCSSTDKSVRIYDAERCTLYTRESGHTEGISDICLIEEEKPDSNEMSRTLISTGMDGTIMIWSVVVTPQVPMTPVHEMSQAQSMEGWESDGTPSKTSAVVLPPLRKVLTKVEVLEFSRGGSPGSPASPRSLSPPRLTRKKSQLAMSTTIAEQDEEEQPMRRPSAGDIQLRGRQSLDRCSSPETPGNGAKPKKQRSKSAAGGSSSARKAAQRRSPSPPLPDAGSMASAVRRRTQANNSRLRRPPSVPTDLRERAIAQRRPSVVQSGDAANFATATEGTIRTLRTYRKKLSASKEDAQLGDLEMQLELTLKMVRDKRAMHIPKSALRDGKPKATPSDDMNDLTVLLDRTNLGEVSTATPKEGIGVEG